MKILPVINNIQKQVVDKSNTYKKAGRQGYSIGIRTSRMYKQNKFRTTINVTKGVMKNTSSEDLPFVAGVIGLLLPVPMACVAFLVIGKIIQKGIKLAKK